LGLQNVIRDEVLWFQARQSEELQAEPVGSPLARRNALAEAMEDGRPVQRNGVPAVQHEEQDEEPGQRNAVPAAVQRGEPGRRNAAPAAAQHEEQEQRNGVREVQRAESEQRNAVPAAVRHEEQEPPDAERRRPSVFQAVLIRSLPPRRLRGLPRRLLLRFWT
jgi:hypothetical protein